MVAAAALNQALVAGADPATAVTAAAAGVSAGQSYTAPTSGERTNAVTGLARLTAGDIAGAGTLLTPLGFTVTVDYDPATGRRYALAVSELATARVWGLYLVDLTNPLALCVAVPHPKSDLHCEQLALRLWRTVPGSMLAMATVHRDASGGTADHSQNTASVFHYLWTTMLGPRGVPQVQIHGFADATAVEQVVVSTGSTSVTHPAATRIADEYAATGLVTTRSWDGTGDTDLLATLNEQAIVANTNGWVWVHVEHNNAVRTTAALWQKAMDALAAANVPALALYRPSPGGTGHFVKPVGSANTTGTSLFFAREDHIHRGQPDDPDLTAIAALDATTDNFMQAKAGAWASRTVAQVKTDLGLSVVSTSSLTATGFGTTTATTYTATLSGGTVPGMTFVAPPSGKILIISSCYFWNSGANTTLVSYEVRAGATIGSGTVFTATDDNTALINNGTNGVVVERTTPDDGLTPGTTYNVRQLCRNSAGTGTFNRHCLIVVPLAA